MRLFRKITKVSIGDYCKDIYDNMLRADASTTDMGKDIPSVVYDSIVEADTSFQAINRSLFCTEIQTIQLELFALAWMDNFKQDNYTIPQSIFTYYYLKEKGKLNIWDAMERYNLAIAKTATMTANEQPMTGETTIGRATITMINNVRSELFKRWAQSNLKDSGKPTKDERNLLTCVARVGNRLGVDIQKHNQLGNRRIAALLLFRVGWKKDADLSPEAGYRLAVATLSMYEVPKKDLQKINLQI